MKDLCQVLEQKETDIERVRKEIAALQFVIPLLVEDADRIERRLALPLSVSRLLKQKETNIERVRKEIAALHFVISLLTEDADRIEHERALALSDSQVRGTGTEGMTGR